MNKRDVLSFSISIFHLTIGVTIWGGKPEKIERDWLQPKSPKKELVKDDKQI